MRTTSSLRLPLTRRYENGVYKLYDADGVLVCIIGNSDMDMEQEEAWASEILEAVNGRGELVEAAGRVCRTAGIIVEGALANEANPATPDSKASYMFDMLNNAVGAVNELRALIRKHRGA